MIGTRHAQALSNTDKADLVAVADPAPSGAALAEQFGVPLYRDIKAVLESEKPDGVVISTPTAHHFEPTKIALEAGCCALVEKPIMATLEEALRIQETEANSPARILVGHHRRHYSILQRAKQIIASGDIGTLVTVNGQWNTRKNEAYFDPDWRKAWEAGPILTNLIHELDALRFICGEIESISAEVSNAVRGWEKEDSAALILRFRSGVLGTFILSDQTFTPWTWEFGTGESAHFPKSGQNSVRFCGTKGGLEFPNLKLWTASGEVADWNHTTAAKDFASELEDAYVNQIEHFADLIRGEAEPLVSAADATATLRATLAVYEAAKTGQKIRLSD